MKKSYRSITEMIQETSDPEIVEAFKKAIAERTIQTRLILHRCAKGLSVQDLADRSSLSVEDIERIEESFNVELHMKEVLAFAQGLGMQIVFDLEDVSTEDNDVTTGQASA